MISKRSLLVQAGQQQQVVDEDPHARGLSLDPAHRIVERSALLDCSDPVQLREPHDRRERGAQLVAGIGDELAHPGLGCLRLFG